MASLPSNYSPKYRSSALLPDGRLIIEGGEYNFFVPTWTNIEKMTGFFLTACTARIDYLSGCDW